jgi:Tol biopolymer transport system component
MPTFSPDGKRIAFSWGAGGITVMNIDGTNREVLESNGWGTQWSPDGRIAFGRGGNIVIYDPQTKMQREILEGEQASRYAYVYWNMGWSRDGKHICFQAGNRTEDTFEIAVAAVAGSQQEFQVLHTSPQRVNGDFSWHPDGERILFSMRTEEGLRLFLLDRKNPGPPVLLPGHPPNHFIAAADWSRDGKQIVFVSHVAPDWNSVQPSATSK